MASCKYFGVASFCLALAVVYSAPLDKFAKGPEAAAISGAQEVARQDADLQDLMQLVHKAEGKEGVMVHTEAVRHTEVKDGQAMTSSHQEEKVVDAGTGG